LDELNATHLGRGAIHYWRSKHGNEVDFVLARRGQPPAAIECKWSAGEFDPASIWDFRNRYSKGPNYVVSADVGPPFTRRHGTLAVRFVSLAASSRISSGPDVRAAHVEPVEKSRKGVDRS